MMSFPFTSVLKNNFPFFSSILISTSFRKWLPPHFPLPISSLFELLDGSIVLLTYFPTSPEMGSIVMDPDDIATFVNGGAGSSFNNSATICTFAHRIRSAGVFMGENPLEFSVPLLLLQLGIGAGTIILFFRLLKPLGQPLIVSQILGGLVLGSSVLGHLETFRETIFPLRGFVSLDLVSSIGNTFYFFLAGLQTDISLMKKIDKKAFGIGSCSVLLPMILTSIYSIVLINTVDSKIAEFFSMVGGVESLISFPMVAFLLSELHLMNSEFGKMALSSSMASGIFSLCVIVLGLLLDPQRRDRNEILSKVCISIVLAALIVLVIQPTILWVIKLNGVVQPLKEGSVITLLLGVLLTAFCSQAFGLHIYFGPLVLGITIPSGPPIGSSLVERLEFVTYWVFMPIFFVKIGLVINIYTIKLKNFIGLSFIIFVGALGKFLGAFVISMYFKLPMRDAVSLGLILNSQGAFELGMFKMMRHDKLLDTESFAIMCICMMVMVAIITPIIRYLFEPSRRYVVSKKRTVMHSRLESDLHVLVCIHDQEDVPSAINLLEALNPMRHSHLAVYMLHLVELLGRANPQLIHHKPKKVRTSRPCPFEQIINAFKYFEQRNRENVRIHPFTAVSPSATMHDDVYSLALDKRTSLILVPFHKRFHSNGVMSLSKSKIKIVNHHILDKAPCSVAIVVERGIFNFSRSIVTNSYSFQIAVVFIGGADDREAMFIGARMAGHLKINLTLIRLLENENNLNHDVEERKHDNVAVVEFQRIMTSNERVMYIEEVVKDGTGTVSVLRSMGNNYDLVMVGRRHNPCSTLVQGLVLWNEHTELGAIGEVLASSNFMGNAMILVVQQHSKVISEDLENHQETDISLDRYLAEDHANGLSSKANHRSFDSSHPLY